MILSNHLDYVLNKLEVGLKHEVNDVSNALLVKECPLGIYGDILFQLRYSSSYVPMALGCYTTEN